MSHALLATELFWNMIFGEELSFLGSALELRKQEDVDYGTH